ncbi:hypothetical protein TNIN_410391 [Trichonephila inaurata madagascariensis]|uniref:Uncharacterized protein n=1 Tax=Trichonephila inaurata madagascariensis TaxID=2747483 RepID=A0A8X6XEC7_9ARAC|nr:hypothetical protein TNIN_410391 [Trichonephila inaurata madagascariensis]
MNRRNRYQLKSSRARNLITLSTYQEVDPVLKQCDASSVVSKQQLPDSHSFLFLDRECCMLNCVQVIFLMSRDRYHFVDIFLDCCIS